MGVIKWGLELFGKKKAKPQLFEHTFAGKQLKKTSEEGRFAPGVRQNILNLMGARAGGEMSRRTASTRGFLASRGMTDSMGGTSISAARLMDAPRRDLQRMLTSKGTELDIMNEQSKVDALERLAAGKDISREKKQAWQQDFYSSVGQGVEDLGRDVGVGLMTGGGWKGAGQSMLMGGENYMGMKQYEQDQELLELLRNKYGM